MSDEELKNDAHPEDASAEAEAASDPLGALLGELEEARQQILYAQAETQNVRRRLEKDAQDARAYAASTTSDYDYRSRQINLHHAVTSTR